MIEYDPVVERSIDDQFVTSAGIGDRREATATSRNLNAAQWPAAGAVVHDSRYYSLVRAPRFIRRVRAGCRWNWGARRRYARGTCRSGFTTDFLIAGETIPQNNR